MEEKLQDEELNQESDTCCGVPYDKAPIGQAGEWICVDCVRTWVPIT